MAHVLLLMVAGLMSGMVGNLSPFGPLSPVLLGVSLAAYLLLRAGVDSPSRLGLVVAAAVAGYYVMIIGGFAGLMVLLMLRDYAPRSIELDQRAIETRPAAVSSETRACRHRPRLRS